MNDDSISPWPLPGSCIRVVYSINGLEMFAIGVLIRSDHNQMTVEQYSDQYGPVEPFRLAIQWSNIIRLTANGPAAGATPPARPWGS
jgi:hypothetical protein